MKLELTLYRHTDVDDTNLGHVYLDVVPPVGTLIAHGGHVWRVDTVYVYPTEPGSINDKSGGYASQGYGTTSQYGLYNLFVEPVEGPFHP